MEASLEVPDMHRFKTADKSCNEYLFSHLYQNTSPNCYGGRLFTLLDTDVYINCKYSNVDLNQLVMRWCKKFAELRENGAIDKNLECRMMQDFLDTLYQRQESFDVMFYMLYHPSTYGEIPWEEERRLFGILWEILRFASTMGLKYFNDMTGTNVKPIDFPSKRFSEINVCPSDEEYRHRYCNECVRPIWYVAAKGNPDVVCRLLNLGAGAPDDSACICKRKRKNFYRPLHPIESLMNRPGNHISFKQKYYSDPEAVFDSVVACFTLLLMDIPYYSQTFNRITSAFKKYSADLAYPRIPSLKHIARFNIRRMLRLNNNICREDVWKMSGLPKALISYMETDGNDFETDEEYKQSE